MSGFLDDIIDPERAPIHAQQGSDEWDLIRLGRFTSSELHKLMGHGWREMTPAELAARPKKGKGSRTTQVPDFSQLSKEADTYIDQKVAETLTGRASMQSYAYPLVWGKENEPLAVQHFEQKFGIETYECGFQTFSDHAGGSPDRFIGETDILETKCPFKSENHMDYLWLTSPWNLKLIHEDYFWQCVSLLLFCKRERLHFVSFDDRFPEKLKMKRLIFETKDFQEEHERIINVLKLAIERKLQRLEAIQKLNP